MASLRRSAKRRAKREKHKQAKRNRQRYAKKLWEAKMGNVPVPAGLNANDMLELLEKRG